jgi:hypothetical protein
VGHGLPGDSCPRGLLLGWPVCSASWRTKRDPPVATRNWMVFSLDVQPTREDRWDRDAMLRGFWGCRDFGW